MSSNYSTPTVNTNNNNNNNTPTVTPSLNRLFHESTAPSVPAGKPTAAAGKPIAVPVAMAKLPGKPTAPSGKLSGSPAKLTGPPDSLHPGMYCQPVFVQPHQILIKGVPGGPPINIMTVFKLDPNDSFAEAGDTLKQIVLPPSVYKPLWENQHVVMGTIIDAAYKQANTQLIKDTHLPHKFEISQLVLQWLQPRQNQLWTSKRRIIGSCLEIMSFSRDHVHLRHK